MTCLSQEGEREFISWARSTMLDSRQTHQNSLQAKERNFKRLFASFAIVPKKKRERVSLKTLSRLSWKRIVNPNAIKCNKIISSKVKSNGGLGFGSNFFVSRQLQLDMFLRGA